MASDPGVVARLRNGVVDRVLPNEWDYRGLSLSRLAGLRLRIGLEWAVQSTVHLRVVRKRLASTRDLRGSRAGRPALILATGPSLQTLDIAGAGEMRARGGALFAVNFYSETKQAKLLKPDYYVLADPVFLADWRENDRARAVWSYIRETPATKVFVPAHCDVHALPDGVEYYFFNGIGLDGWSRNISPMKPRGFSGITAYHAISIAMFMGFAPVFTIGIDNDAFRAVKTDSEGVVLGGHHAYPDNREYRLPPSDDRVASMLEDYARLFGDLRMFNAGRLVNLASPSLITAFPHGTIREWLDSDGGSTVYETKRSLQ